MPDAGSMIGSSDSFVEREKFGQQPQQKGGGEKAPAPSKASRPGVGGQTTRHTPPAPKRGGK
jgi:hypothetical protein